MPQCVTVQIEDVPQSRDAFAVVPSLRASPAAAAMVRGGTEQPLQLRLTATLTGMLYVM